MTKHKGHNSTGIQGIDGEGVPPGYYMDDHGNIIPIEEGTHPAKTKKPKEHPLFENGSPKKPKSLHAMVNGTSKLKNADKGQVAGHVAAQAKADNSTATKPLTEIVSDQEQASARDEVLQVVQSAERPSGFAYFIATSFLVVSFGLLAAGVIEYKARREDAFAYQKFMERRQSIGYRIDAASIPKSTFQLMPPMTSEALSAETMSSMSSEVMHDEDKEYVRQQYVALYDLLMEEVDREVSGLSKVKDDEKYLKKIEQFRETVSDLLDNSRNFIEHSIWTPEKEAVGIKMFLSTFDNIRVREIKEKEYKELVDALRAKQSIQ